MERAGVRALFAGDVISRLRGDRESHSTYGRPLGTYSVYLPPRYRGDARAYLSSLRALRALPVPDLVLPGHPRAETEPQSPCLSQRAWEELLDQGISDMEILLARFEADGANFLDDNPKRLLPDLYYLGNFQGAAIYAFFAASQLFLVDAPGGPGLKKFVEARLDQFGLKSVGPATVLLTSCGLEATAGLNELVEQGHARVVASSSGVDHMRRTLPTGTVILPAEELSHQGWFAVTPIPLRGRGFTPIAYCLPWAGKAVLFSGRIPIRVKEETLSRTAPGDLEIERCRRRLPDLGQSTGGVETRPLAAGGRHGRTECELIRQRLGRNHRRELSCRRSCIEFATLTCRSRCSLDPLPKTRASYPMKEGYR